MANVEFLTVTKITGLTVRLDGSIQYDCTEASGRELCIGFESPTHLTLLQPILSSSPAAAQVLVFRPEALETSGKHAPSDSRNRRIRILLTPKIAIHIELDSNQRRALMALLSDSPTAAQLDRKQ